MEHCEDIKEISEKLEKEKTKPYVQIHPEQEKIRIPIAHFPPFGGTESLPPNFQEVMNKTSERLISKTPKLNDSIKPDHYNGNECQEIILKIVKGKSPEEAFFIGQIIKYLYRFKNKGGLTDVLKGQSYYTSLIEFLEKS